MTVEDNFLDYEALAARNMLPEDFYSADELKKHIETGYVSAWWIKDPNGMPIAWCGMNNDNKDWKDACNFLGVIVDHPYRNTNLALRMIRHIIAQAGQKPLTTYIQPGLETERLLKPLGFEYVGIKAPWNFYVRHPKPKECDIVSHG